MQAVSQPTLLLATEDAAWTEIVRNALTTAGYRLSSVASLANAENAIAEHQPDVIIATPSSATLIFYELVFQRKFTERPLLVLITDEPALSDTTLSTADIVLPPHPHYIARQLETFLNLQQENAQLRQAQHDHTQQVTKQQAEIEKHKRAASEIEILKNAIVRNISHELKTPLLQVKSAISLIKEDLPGSRLVEYAEFATARLEALIKNITMLGSSLEMNPGPIIVRDVIEYTRRSLARIWQHKDQVERVHIQIEEGLPPVMADKQGLSTVLQLLVDNALKFSSEDSLVTVVAERVDNKARITVKDNGIGIPPEKFQMIFDMFYQVDSSSTRRYGGAGVGLSLVKLILDHHNEKIFVESIPGEGSRFYFHLAFADISS